MSKISELSDGGSIQASDYLIAVRSGGNVKVRMDQINVDQIDLGDNEFIRLGNSQDLTLVHNASNSIINQAGIGDLLIQKAGSTKLTVNSTGIDVTGTVTADGLTISAPSGDTPASIGTTTAGSFLSISDGNTTSGRSPLVGVITDDLVFYTSSGSYSEKVRIRADGSVGIGTDLPSKLLTIGSSTTANTTARLNCSTTAGSDTGMYSFGIDDTVDFAGIKLDYSERTTHGLQVFTASAYGYPITLSTTGSQDVVLDTSGNLLVGKTTLDNTTAGIVLYGQSAGKGAGSFVRDGGVSLIANRLTSDGTIQEFFKDGTTVGSIGTTSSNVVIGTGNTGLRFYDGGSAIIPHTAAGGSSNGLVDLGQDGFNEFKDLYLSGGVKLSGTSGIDALSTSVSTSAVVITSAVDYGTLSIVAGNSAGNIFTDLVFWATTMGATVVTSGTVSGGPAARTYTVVGSALKLAMASGTYAVKTTNLKGSL